jgi:hypothetical protein
MNTPDHNRSPKRLARFKHALWHLQRPNYAIGNKMWKRRWLRPAQTKGKTL